MNPRKIVVDDAVPYAQEIFGHLGDVHLHPGKSITPDIVKDAKALIIRSRTQIHAQLLAHSKVEFVGSTVVGLDHVDQNYLTNQGIAFYSAQGCNANSVAEFVINALFEVAQTQGFNVTDKTLGIIGVGNVGSRLFNKAQTLGIKCLVNDPPKQHLERNANNHAYDYVDLDTALSADIISVHTPLTFDGEHPTFDLINANKLSRIQPHQILINAARGGIINEAAWTKTQTLANIIDCWENEPNIDQALYQTALFATPHIAGHSFEAKLAGSEMVYSALCKHWQVTENHDWSSMTPSPQHALNVDELAQNSAISDQTILHSIFRQCHDIRADHQALQAPTHIETQKKYEFFRRNYPIYHEWHCHQVTSTGRSNLDNLLKTLGFTQF